MSMGASLKSGFEAWSLSRRERGRPRPRWLFTTHFITPTIIQQEQRRKAHSTRGGRGVANGERRVCPS